MPEAARSRISFGDLQRDLGDSRGRPMSRAVLERLLRDYGRELPTPEIVGGARLWRIEDLDAFREVWRRDQEAPR